jgi:hypothetical protein
MYMHAEHITIAETGGATGTALSTGVATVPPAAQPLSNGDGDICEMKLVSIASLISEYKMSIHNVTGKNMTLQHPILFTCQ